MGTFRITTEPRIGAAKSNMSLQELNNLIDQKRKEAKLRSNGAKYVYLYNNDLTVLYYTAVSQNALKSELNISHDSSRNCIKTGALYVNYFKIMEELIPEASQASITLSELKYFIQIKRGEHRVKYLKIGRVSNSIKVSVQSNSSGEVAILSSISAASSYLRAKGVVVDPSTITKYLDSGKVYKGYLFTKCG